MKILVTGSAHGLGAAICEALKGAGHSVYGFDIAYGDDIRYPDESPSAGTIDEIDVVINCAGVNSNEWFEDVQGGDLERLMEVNAFGIVHMTQHFLPQLKKSRGIV